MKRTVIATEKAPSAIGPYSQAVRAGNLLFCSGQLGLDPASGELEGGVEAQARRALENLGAVLEAAGGGFDSVVKTTIYLADIGDYAAVNQIYGERFGDSKPARAAVEVARLPKDARVEIEAIAVLE